MKLDRLTTRGMTLVEVIVVIFILTFLLLGISESITTFYQYNAYTIAQANQVAHARRGVEFLVRDIREMTYADDGTFPLVTMGSTSISFYSDIDKDDSVELVEYTLSSTTLYKYIYDSSGFPPVYSTTTPGQTLIISEYVQNLDQGQVIFSYYDENGALATPTTTVTDIRYVDVTTIVNVDPLRDPGEFMLRSSASLRNLKDDL